MSWDSGQTNRRNFQTANIGGRDFVLVPKSDGSDGFLGQGQGNHTDLQRFNDPDISDLPEYIYMPLRQDKKRIRLLKLYPGEASGTRIFCELMEAEYDKNFHVLTKIDFASDDPKGKNGAGRGYDNKKEDPRSDTETRYRKMCYWETPNGKMQKKNGYRETALKKLERKKRQAEREMKMVIDEETKNAAEEKKKEDEFAERRFQEWKEVTVNEEKYEALSWCWGNQDEDYAILINRGKRPFRKRVRKELALALKHLRRAGEERTLWIDAICINQADPNERNHQVQMMSRIYTRAQQVCIWLGEADTDSEIAINFIKDEMKSLKNFDVISSDQQYSRKWQALMSLMQRDWFFRRWVVQEIALASAATVYCGSLEIPWKSFAVAVELFVEVETATHRLSEVMKRDEKFRHVPGWFEYVSELGASLLVQATGKVFRTKRSPLEPESDSSDDDTEHHAHDEEGDEQKREQERIKKKLKKIETRTRERLEETQTIDPLERRSLLSLEYLVSTMFIFQATEPRDVVYALLAIARDASPFAPAHYGHEDQKLFLVMTLLDRFLAEKPFVVDYSRPYSDVSRDFVEFSIRRTHKTDPHQALDILCRPWALAPPTGKSVRLKRKKNSKTNAQNEPDSGKRRLMEPPRKVWKIPDVTQPETARWVTDMRTNEDYRNDAAAHSRHCPHHGCTHSIDEPDCLIIKWRNKKERYFPSKERDDIDLPSWVARVSRAPFMLDHAPGMDMRKTSRANADPLVGSPMDGHRNYNAAGSETLDINNLKFKKRPVLGHYSLYVNGFELDTVDVVADASQLGSIPRDWLKLGGWDDFDKDPPDQLWRTIVADRGRDNRNPPYYYARACKESVNKGGHLGGSVNTTALINDEQNSIVAEFCRRVHAVIWNRCLFKTKKGRLGLANKVEKDDKVCILYGCTVPVILGRREKKRTEYDDKHKIKTPDDLVLESEEDKVEILKARIGRARSNRERRAKYRSKNKEYGDRVWEEMMDAMQQYLEDEEEKRKIGEHEQADVEKERQAKETQKEFRETWAKSVKQAIDEVKIASAVHVKATAEGKVAQESVEKALADQKAAHEAVAAQKAAAAVAARGAEEDVEDAAAAVTAQCAQEEEDAITTTQKALICSAASITAQETAIADAATGNGDVDLSAAVAAAKKAAAAFKDAITHIAHVSITQDATATATADIGQDTIDAQDGGAATAQDDGATTTQSDPAAATESDPATAAQADAAIPIRGDTPTTTQDDPAAATQSDGTVSTQDLTPSSTQDDAAAAIQSDARVPAQGDTPSTAQSDAATTTQDDATQSDTSTPTQGDAAATTQNDTDGDVVPVNSNSTWENLQEATKKVTAAMREAMNSQRAIDEALTQFIGAEANVAQMRDDAKEAARNTVQVPNNPSASASVETHGSDRNQATPETSATSNDEAEGTNASKASKDDEGNCWYEFKGECYLHGMMDGEAMREKLYKNLNERKFELR
jgi:hypothetical protein